MKYKFNGVKPLNKAVLANNDLVGAGSWIEFAPGLSQAKIWQDAAGDDKIETLNQDDIRVLPGFGVSANPDFSSQGNRLFFYMARYNGVVSYWQILENLSRIFSDLSVFRGMTDHIWCK